MSPLIRAFAALAALVLVSGPVMAQTIERIRETGELRLGFRADAAPLSFADKNGNPGGYSPMLCAGVAQKITNQLKMENLSVTFHVVDTDERFDKVAKGEVDLLCGAATITLSRRKLVDFSVPTYVDGTAVAYPAGTDLVFSELSGKTVGVRANTTTEQSLLNTLVGQGVEATVAKFDSHGDGLTALENGQISAYFADQSILLFLIASSEMSGNFQVSDEILTIEKQGLAMARGDTEFRLMVDAAISELFSSGAMEELLASALPGVTPGAALKAMYLLSPTIR